MTLPRRIRERLTERLFACRPDVQTWPNRHDYVVRTEDVLVAGVNLEHIREDLESADGGELAEQKDGPPKFHAVHSSSALVANTFGPFRREPGQLSVAGESGFQSLQFEFQCPTGAGVGRANLDVLISSSDCTVAVESKLTEILNAKVAKFSFKYDRVVEEVADQQWKALYRTLTAQPDAYRYVDAAQLVKHYLGLRRHFPTGPVRLVYLFWEPTNATAFEAYREHALEVEKLCDKLVGAKITLTPLRYSQLWDELEKTNARHAARLRARYAFTV